MSELHFKVNDGCVYAEYGLNGDEMIEESMINAIQTVANTKPLREKIGIVLNVEKGMKIDEQRLKSAYKNTFSKLVKSKQHEIKRCILFGLIMLFVGISILCFTVFVAKNFTAVVEEFFDIMSWVFCWAGVEVLTVDLIQLEIDKRKCKRLYESNIQIKIN